MTSKKFVFSLIACSLLSCRTSSNTQNSDTKIIDGTIDIPLDHPGNTSTVGLVFSWGKFEGQYFLNDPATGEEVVFNFSCNDDIDFKELIPNYRKTLNCYFVKELTDPLSMSGLGWIPGKITLKTDSQGVSYNMEKMTIATPSVKLPDNHKGKLLWKNSVDDYRTFGNNTRSEGMAIRLEKQSPLCTGTLISPKLIVTAAHCVDDWHENPDDISKNKRKLKVAFVEQTPSGPKIIEQINVIEAKKFPKRAGFVDEKIGRNLHHTFSSYDVAWLKLEKPASSQFKPLKIFTDQDQLIADKDMDLAGHGLIDTNEDIDLLNPTRPLFEKRLATVQIDRYHHDPTFANLIVFKENSRGSCYGDSGGPAFIKVGDEWTVAGATQGKNSLLGNTELCGKDGIYTFLGNYVDWLRKTSGEPIKVTNESLPRQETEKFEFGNFTTKSFQELCNKKEPLSDLELRARLTLIMYGGTHNCLESIEKFKNLQGTELDIFHAYGTYLNLNWVAALGVTKFTKIASSRNGLVKGLDAIPKFTELETLILADVEVSNSDFEHISKLPKLKTLDLRFNKGLSNISGLKNLSSLTELDISSTSVTDFSALNGMNIESFKAKKLNINQLSDLPINVNTVKTLYLSNTKLTNLNGIEKFKNLEKLEIDNTMIEDVSPLLKLEKLNYLNVLNTPAVKKWCPMAGTPKSLICVIGGWPMELIER